MKAILLSLTCAALLTGTLLCSAETATLDDRDARARQATEQRLAYAKSKEYNPYEFKSRDLLKSAAGHLDKGKFTKAIAQAKKGLKHSPCNIDLLMVLASAYRESGDVANADQARNEWMGLMDSILRSGDGRDFATAFQVISVDEEYAVVGILHLETVHQSLVHHEGSQFDVLQVKEPKSGQQFDLYFNVDLPMRKLNEQFSAPKK